MNDLRKIDAGVLSLIESRLDSIETEDDVRIIYACESGSRAWGFASTDSDYDVRFIYVRRMEWYLSFDVERRRDVIERPIESDIDLGGWDLRKALVLFAKSNPPLLEWLVSPIVYRERFHAVDKFRAQLPLCYSPTACAYHYLHMARNNHREFFSGDLVKQKKYFYVLRPILAIEWIQQDLGPVPMEFEAMLERLVPAGPLRDEIDKLLHLKRSGTEMGLAPRNAIVCDFMKKEIARFDRKLDVSPAASQKVNAILNQFFREIVEAATAEW